jgi:putative DNA primase/helicase
MTSRNGEVKRSPTESTQEIIDQWEWLWPTSADASFAAQAAELNCIVWTAPKLDREVKGKRIIVACQDTDDGRRIGLEVARQCLKYKAVDVRLWPIPEFGSKFAAMIDWQLAHRLRLTIEMDEPWRHPEYRIATESAQISSPATPQASAKFPCTDRGNAERMVAAHGPIIRHCHPWSKWLVYSGARWRVDDTASVDSLAKLSVRQILVDAAQSDDASDRLSAVKWWHKSESRSRIEGMIALATSEDGVPILPDELDRDPWLFNVRNGTLDLRSGRLGPHRREDMITALAPIDFDEEATCPLWLQTIGRIFGDDDGLIRFWQQLCGICLTGIVTEQILPIAYGSGANGKSTVLGAMMEILGPDYAISAPPGLLTIRHGESHPTERAALFGKRLVVDMESAEGARLNEAWVKQLTGGDRITARRMREDFWEFPPTHKIIMVTNHKPEVCESKGAIWRRIKLVPFTVVIPDEEQERDLPQRLRAEYPGILAWCVRGCLDWQENSLSIPADVQEATQEYRQGQDILGAFLADECVQIAGARVKASALYACYRGHCSLRGEMIMSQRKFGMTMTERGFKRIESHGMWYLDIGLRDDSEKGSDTPF